MIGDSTNDLGALSGDPNTSIQESKAFTCDVRAGRRDRSSTAKLADVHRADGEATVERGPRRRGAAALMAATAACGRRRASGRSAATTPSASASSPTRPCASAARRARSRASSGTTCRPTAASWSPAGPTTTRGACPGRPGATCASSRTPQPTADGRRWPRATGCPTWCRWPRRCAAARPLAVHVGRLQALHERGLHGRVPDRRDHPHRVRHGRHPARRLQRLRLLHPVVPVRRARPRPRGRPRRQVHALLRPPGGRARAGVRQGVPDRLDRVRPVRGARRHRPEARRPRCTSAASSRPTCTARATRPRPSWPAASARSSC